jgi:hypothetical protein
MKFKEPENRNYAAVIVRIDSLHPLDNSDNLLGAPLLGMQAVVSKDTEIGTIGVVFVAGTQLSDEYTSRNNLFRHHEFNEDKEKTGFIEDSRRVKALKLRGNRSDALFMPLSSLSYTKVNLGDFKIGDSFEELNGYEICKKYEIQRKSYPIHEKNKHKVFNRVDEKLFPRHYDTDQYYRVLDTFKPHTEIVVTQKLHGTLLRFSNIPVKRKLTIVEKWVSKLGVKVQKEEYAHVYGSNRVIKDANNDRQQHFYDHDIWTEVGKTFDDMVPENFVVYGELIGWTPDGAPIQKHYTYQVPHMTSDFYVYRVAQVNNQAVLTDLSWDQVKEWCKDRGLKTVAELWRGKHQDFNPDEWLDVDYHNKLHGGYPSAVPLDDDSPCDEGICIRVDGLAPYIVKLKSPEFFAHEDRMTDEGAVDVEEEIGKGEQQ